MEKIYVRSTDYFLIGFRVIVLVNVTMLLEKIYYDIIELFL